MLSKKEIFILILNIAFKRLNGALAKCQASIAKNHFESWNGYVQWKYLNYVTNKFES